MTKRQAPAVIQIDSSAVTVTDNFCGAGGSSTGAKAAGAEVVVAANHWEIAIETHNTNHPEVRHVLTNLSTADPGYFPTTTIALFSPECTTHTIGRGKAVKNQAQLSLWEPKAPDPSVERSRQTMWDVVRFTEHHHYRLVVVENVVDINYWPPLFSWYAAMESLGYKWKTIYMSSEICHPTPQRRDRWYTVFWQKGMKAPDLDFRPPAPCLKCEEDVYAIQSWKPGCLPWGRYMKQYIYCCPKCGKEVRPYYYPAATAINWKLPMQRIGDRKKPLADNTVRRIQMGINKFRGENFLVSPNNRSIRAFPLADVHPVQTGSVNYGIAANPFLVNTSHTSKDTGYVYGADEVFPAQTTAQSMSLIAPPLLVPMDRPEHPKEPDNAFDVSATMTTRNNTALAVPPGFMVELHKTSDVRSFGEPVSTVSTLNHHGVAIPPFTVGYYGNSDVINSVYDTTHSARTKDGYGLAVPPDVDLEDVDNWYFRMLSWEEIRAVMAFPQDYVILGKVEHKIKQLGNAVTPPAMREIVKRCMAVLN